jgi:hypothetical protein
MAPTTSLLPDRVSTGKRASRKKLIPIAEGAAQARIPLSRETLRGWIVRGRIPGEKLGGRFFISPEVAEQLREGSF